MNRWNDVINAWLKEFPEIKLTDNQYKALESYIEIYGETKYYNGFEDGE